LLCSLEHVRSLTVTGRLSCRGTPSPAPLVAHSSARHPRRLWCGARVPRAHGVWGRDREPIRGRAMLRPQVSIRAARDRLATATGSAEPLGRVLDHVVPRSRTAGVDAEVEDPQADAMVAQVVGQRCEPCRDLPRRDSSVMRICRDDGSVTTRWCLLRQGLDAVRSEFESP
jgi:hypothetical protein